MSAVNEGQGGLIALSVEECDRLIAALRRGSYRDMDIESDYELWARLTEWRRRHTPAGAIDGD